MMLIFLLGSASRRSPFQKIPWEVVSDHTSQSAPGLSLKKGDLILQLKALQLLSVSYFMLRCVLG